MGTYGRLNRTGVEETDVRLSRHSLGLGEGGDIDWKELGEACVRKGHSIWWEGLELMAKEWICGNVPAKTKKVSDQMWFRKWNPKKNKKNLCGSDYWVSRLRPNWSILFQSSDPGSDFGRTHNPGSDQPHFGPGSYTHTSVHLLSASICATLTLTLFEEGGGGDCYVIVFDFSKPVLRFTLLMLVYPTGYKMCLFRKIVCRIFWWPPISVWSRGPV